MANETCKFLVKFSDYEKPSLVEKVARTAAKVPSKLWRLIDEERERLIAQRGSNFSVETTALQTLKKTNKLKLGETVMDAYDKVSTAKDIKDKVENISDKVSNFAFTSYRHVSGQTGVKSFEVDSRYPERIGVRFKRQRNKQPYYYSYQKAGKKKVEEMKKLADRGQGLNSFIFHKAYYDYDGPRRSTWTKKQDINKLTVIERLRKLLRLS